MLPILIHNDQKGFIKGRYISVTIFGWYLWFNILYQITQNTRNIDMLLLIDFEKAFDSVSHKCIFKIYTRFVKFLTFVYEMCYNKVVKLFYNKCQSVVLAMRLSSQQNRPICTLKLRPICTYLYRYPGNRYRKMSVKIVFWGKYYVLRLAISRWN
jgi:hypothetical protein